jgi:hypothetical protein
MIKRILLAVFLTLAVATVYDCTDTYAKIFVRRIDNNAKITIKDCGTMQGGAIKDTSAIFFACADSGGNNAQVRIVQYNLSGRKQGESSRFSANEVGHANDLAYSAEGSMGLIIGAWQNNNKDTDSRLRFLNTANLKLKGRTKKLGDTTTSNICYDSVGSRYVSHGIVYKYTGGEEGSFKKTGKVIYDDTKISGTG